MKKYSVLITGGLLFLMNACKEIGPAIDFTPDIVDTSFSERAFDTAYAETPEAPDSKTVLVEEYTGVQCPNCPEGTLILSNYQDAHPGKMIAVALHGGKLAAPINNSHGTSRYDFRNQDVMNLMNSYFGGLPPQPAAAIDRIKMNGEYFNTSRSQWAGIITQEATQPAPVNIDLTSRYDTAYNKVVVKVKVSYTLTVSAKQSLSVWLMEDGIVDMQLNQTAYIPDYIHNHVFRDFLTQTISGSSFLDTVSVKMPGQVYERTFVYTPRSSQWVLENCKIVAFVHNNEQGDKAVVQAAEADLIPR